MNEFNALQAQIWATAVHGKDKSADGKTAKMDTGAKSVGGYLLQQIQVEEGGF